MPQQVLPDAKKFLLFTQYIQYQGFRQLSRVESVKNFGRLGLQPPTQRNGYEVGFIFTANGLTVRVWTTFLAQNGCARKKDAGWIVICEGDRPVYFSHPMMRTEGFLRRLYKNALIAKERVLQRPLCPVCHGYMRIVRGKGLKARYWRCAKCRERASWDQGLSQASLDWLKKERLARRRYHKQLRKVGKPIAQAMLGRKPWRVGRPENIT